jgi:hypothetical protein
MVDLNRQIRATQARQGGFSSHVLPGAVPYALPAEFPHYRLAPDITLNEQETGITSATLNRAQPTIDWIFGPSPSNFNFSNVDNFTRLESGGPSGTNALELVQPVYDSNEFFGITRSLVAASDSSVIFEDLGGYTLEFFVRMADTLFSNQASGRSNYVNLIAWGESPAQIYGWLEIQYRLFLTGPPSNRVSNQTCFIGALGFGTAYQYTFPENFITEAPVAMTDWVHYAISQNGNQASIYIDGQRVAETTTTFLDFAANQTEPGCTVYALPHVRCITVPASPRLQASRTSHDRLSRP